MPLNSASAPRSNTTMPTEAHSAVQINGMASSSGMTILPHTQNVVTPLLKVISLSVSFRINKKDSIETVKSISFEIGQNSTVALVGESGSGNRSLRSPSWAYSTVPHQASMRVVNCCLKEKFTVNDPIGKTKTLRKRNFDDFSGADELVKSGLHGWISDY